MIALSSTTLVARKRAPPAATKPKQQLRQSKLLLQHSVHQLRRSNMLHSNTPGAPPTVCVCVWGGAANIMLHADSGRRVCLASALFLVSQALKNLLVAALGCRV
jgi:hypothetical protein